MMEKNQELFETKFTKGSGCWNWTVNKSRLGYGRFVFAGKRQLAHRVAYQLYVGAIPEGLCVCHRCDNPSCVRPDHLFLGTMSDNMHDRHNKGRDADQSGGNNGHAKLTEEQVKMIRARRADGDTTLALAKAFGVTQTNISKIVLRRRWCKV